MTKKSDTPFGLDSLFRHEGVPPKMIMDGHPGWPCGSHEGRASGFQWEIIIVLGGGI